MIQVLFAIFIWGTLGVFALWANIPMIDLAFYRCILALIPLFIYLMYTKQLNVFRFENDSMSNAIEKKTVLLILLGGIFLVLNWVLLFWSFELSSITLGNTSYYIQPIFLIAIGVIFFKDKSNFLQCILISMSLVGVLMTSGFFSGKLEISATSSIFIGLLSAISAALFYSLFTLISKAVHVLTAAQLCLVQFTIGSLVLFPFTQNVSIEQVTHYNFIYVAIIGVVHTGLAYVLYFQGVKKVPLATVAALSYIDPIVAVISDVIFFEHQLDNIQIVGILFTLGASYFISKPKKITMPTDNLTEIEKDIIIMGNSKNTVRKTH